MENKLYEGYKKSLLEADVSLPMVRRFVHSVSDKVVGTGLIKEFGMIRSSSNDANLIDVSVYFASSNVKPAAIAKQGLEEAKNNNIDVVIVDSAGRLQIDKTMMDELREVKQSIKPNEFLLVVDAMTGQEAAALVNTFNVEIEISSAILTKLDGDSRGGVAFSVREVLGKHINLVGHGERIEDLEPFY